MGAAAFSITKNKAVKGYQCCDYASTLCAVNNPVMCMAWHTGGICDTCHEVL